MDYYLTIHLNFILYFKEGKGSSCSKFYANIMQRYQNSMFFWGGRGLQQKEFKNKELCKTILFPFSRVERPTSGGLEIDTRRCFRVVPSNERTMKTFVFGCAKDGERKVLFTFARVNGLHLFIYFY